jgi:hypothetical protein
LWWSSIIAIIPKRKRKNEGQDERKEGKKRRKGGKGKGRNEREKKDLWRKSSSSSAFYWHSKQISGPPLYPIS